MTQAVFTIVSRNYFAYARTLGDSLRKSNPDVEFNILIVDRKDPSFELENPGWRITWVEDLGIPSFYHVAFKYDILELNTNVKPTFAKRLLQKNEKVIYLDPDIFVYSSLQSIFDLLDSHAVVLTPHITEPINDGNLPGEPEFLNSGIYNLGFVGFSNEDEALKLLSWWESRCLSLAYNEQAMGFFVDQKWMDFAPSLCSTAFILRDQQYNVAYWNLHERIVEWESGDPTIGGKSLVFFHFSGLPSQGDARVSKYQTRFNLLDRPDVGGLFIAYREHLKNNLHEAYLQLPYSFGCFSNGVEISQVARRVAAVSENFENVDDPFSADGSLYGALCSSYLIAYPKNKTFRVEGSSQNKSNEEPILARIFSWIFFLLLRVFGPIRYERLMRYIARNSNLRNQGFLLKRKL